MSPKGKRRRFSRVKKKLGPVVPKVPRQEAVTGRSSDAAHQGLILNLTSVPSRPQTTNQPPRNVPIARFFSNPSAMSVYIIKGHPIATCTRTVVTAFEEAGVPYEIDVVDLFNQAHKTPEYLENVQPFGQIPALVDGDFKMFESRAIIRYIAEKHGAKDIYPTDFQERARVEQWLSVQQSNSGPTTDIIFEFYFKAMRGGTADESKIPEFTAKLNTLLTILDKQLASTNAFFAGENFTLADISFLPNFEYLLKVPQFANAFDNFANLKRWWATSSSRPSWQKAIASN